jgi:hypothetical protein
MKIIAKKIDQIQQQKQYVEVFEVYYIKDLFIV